MTSDISGRTSRSHALFETAQHIIPGGVNSPVRAFTAVGGDPLFLGRGSGPYVWDVDGNRYLDFVMSWGPLIHGHAYPPAIEAIAEAAARGTSFGAPTEAEVRLARLVTRAVPSVEMVRFVSSGTEAAMSAIRLARGYTGRDLIVKFAGNYHGHADALLVRAGSGSLTFGVPSTPGVPASTTATTLVAEFNNADQLEETFREHGPRIAAVIVEPVAGNMGVVVPQSSFLNAIQRLCQSTGALFICDEVITGFRVAFGGSQSVTGLTPDLTVLGKIVGGGLPVGAYGGRRTVMEAISPAGPVYQAGTLSGNPLAMAAGIASVTPLQSPVVYETLGRRTAALVAGLRELALRAGVPVTVNCATGMMTLFFRQGSVETLAHAESADTQRYARFFHAMLRRGIYLPPSQFEAWMLSTAHGDQEIQTTLGAAEEALGELDE